MGMKKIFATEDNIHVVAQVERLLHLYVGLCCINFSDHKTLWSTRQPTHHIAQHPNPRYAGLIAWSAFEYASLLNGYHAVKSPGVADVFRIPKLGAAFYLSQVDPSVKPVIEPNFYWDFGPRSPEGPGKRAVMFSNCERLKVQIQGSLYSPCIRIPPSSPT